MQKLSLNKFSDNYLIKLIFNLLLIVAWMSLCRILFFAFNTSLFQNTTQDILTAYFYGIRFDISAILYVNAIFILFVIIPFKFRSTKIYQKTIFSIFIITNSIGLLANFVDIIYYRYTLKRTTADIFSYLGVGGDFNKLLPQFLHDFWYIAAIWIVIIILTIYLYKKPIPNNSLSLKPIKYYVTGFLIFILSIGITIIGMRGGLQLRPINIISASLHVDSKLSPVVLNTPFTIIQTIGKEDIKIKNTFSEKELNSIYNPIHNTLYNNLLPDSILPKKNIVLIIVESLSQEHISYYNSAVKKVGNLTPFIDSLCSKSLCFNGFANGKKSIEGIPALISGIPTLMTTSFISSPYANNQHLSIASGLKKLNYTNLFFHGGTNGTMGFNSYAKNVGFDYYIGRTEYNNESDYDEHWGIWDEPFLQFSIKEMNKHQNKPFFSVIFTLSSHHPYSIPEKYKSKLPKGEAPIHKTIAYTDYALSQFFKTASKESWYKNTMFIITADHTSEPYFINASNNYGLFQIPIIFFDPSNDLSIFSNHSLFQQIDLLPSILAYLKYPAPIFAFGNNRFDTCSNSFAIEYIHPNYQLIKDGYLLNWNSETVTALYNIKNDSLLTTNLKDKKVDFVKKEELFLKAFVQQYNNRLIRNQTSIKQ